MDERTFEIMLFGEFSLSYHSQVESFDLTVKNTQNTPVKISVKNDAQKLVTTQSIQVVGEGPAEEPKHRHGKFPDHITNMLKHWLHTHVDHPYPSPEEKDELSKKTGLTRLQIENWFINARKRCLKKL